eukprot:1161082-Pelagomonas_calceolata.AAC.13
MCIVLGRYAGSKGSAAEPEESFAHIPHCLHNQPSSDQPPNNLSVHRFASPGWQQRQHSCASKNWRADHQITSRLWTTCEALHWLTPVSQSTLRLEFMSFVLGDHTIVKPVRTLEHQKLVAILSCKRKKCAQSAAVAQERVWFRHVTV